MSCWPDTVSRRQQKQGDNKWMRWNKGKTPFRTRNTFCQLKYFTILQLNEFVSVTQKWIAGELDYEPYSFRQASIRTRVHEVRTLHCKKKKVNNTGLQYSACFSPSRKSYIILLHFKEKIYYKEYHGWICSIWNMKWQVGKVVILNVARMYVTTGLTGNFSLQK